MHSMTGYGRGQKTIDNMEIAVEIRSVNHRYFEYSSRISRGYTFLDEKIKPYIQNSITRGKVELSVRIDNGASAESQVIVNHMLAKGYVDAINDVSKQFGLSNELSAVSLLRYPDIVTIQQAEVDESFVWERVKIVIDAALQQHGEMRAREGRKMCDDIQSRITMIADCIKTIEDHSPQIVRNHMERVTARMRELIDGVNVDEHRLLNEAAIFADKVAVDEETVRLRSHLGQMQAIILSDQPVGRKLDFLVQEINREINTVGSKCQDVNLAHIVVDVKAELEKIREQIQNIE